MGLGLKSFTLYFIKNPQKTDECRYQVDNWDSGYTCDLGASDDDPNVFTFSVKKAYLPGTRTFLEVERYTLVAIEDLDPNYSPKHQNGQLSNLCKDYNMKLNFMVNKWNPEDEDKNNEIETGIERPITQISPLPDSGFKERPFDEDDVKVTDYEDVNTILPVSIGIILILVLCAVGLFCFHAHSRNSNKNNSNQNTIESSYDIREGGGGIIVGKNSGSVNWPENSIKTQVPQRVSPNFINSPVVNSSHAFQHLQNINNNFSSTLHNHHHQPTIGTIVGGNLENTTLSTSLKYRRASPTNPMFQNNQFYRTMADPYPDSLSKPLLRPLPNVEVNNSQVVVGSATSFNQQLTVRNNAQNVTNLPSPNDTGCETGASNDGSIPPGATVMI